jgi:SAM-dependent methyltransferase
LARPGGSALDLAAGGGRHTRLLLGYGMLVTAVDRDPDQQSDAAGLIKIKADLEVGHPWPLAGQRFDLIIVTNYLYRPILPDLIGTLAPSGLLLYETFALGNERFGQPSNPDFLLRPGELRQAVAGRLEIIEFEEIELGPPRRAMVQRIAARAPSNDTRTARPPIP